MREFILRARKARTDFFDIDDLVGAGMMNLVADCISSALLISNSIRTDTNIHVVLEGPKTPPRTVSFYGNSVKGLGFDERSIAVFILNALKKGRNLRGDEELDVSQGVAVSKKSFEKLVKEKKEQGKQLVYLHKKGRSMSDIKIKENVVFVFGDYIGMPSKTEKFLDNMGAVKVSISPVTLFASHCIVIVHNELDRMDYC